MQPGALAGPHFVLFLQAQAVVAQLSDRSRWADTAGHVPDSSPALCLIASLVIDKAPAGVKSQIEWFFARRQAMLGSVLNKWTVGVLPASPRASR